MICYFDSFSGIAGDMTVGALLDAGANSAALLASLESLGTGAEFAVEKVKRRGITATKFHVRGGEQKTHRHLPQILAMIDRGALPATAREKARAVFQCLAESEAEVHGVPLEKVHFHEVGAVDSICDIVGACVGLDLLGVNEIYSSAVNTGSGTVNTEHGLLPVPAPATARLMLGKPVYARGPEMELTTPTGAAILAALALNFGPPPAMRLHATGYGAGDRDFPSQANVLRVMIGERSGAPESTRVSVLEANIDDSTPQILGYAIERLLEAGALDVTLEPVFMKKNRPATRLSVIARPEDRERLAEIVFAETSTLGLRVSEAERRVRERRIETVETRYGAVRIKVSDNGITGTGGTGFAPEYDDCRKLAAATGTPLKTILAEAQYEYLKRNR